MATTTVTPLCPLDELAGFQPTTKELQRFEYQPLAENEDLRLLIIHPGAVGEDMRCSLLPSALAKESPNSCPEYEALSYTWGSNNKTHGVFINELLLPVTENLYSALQRFRLPEQPRTLWADAICINQDDTSERNSQVRSMGHIYSASKSVLVWLGEEDGDTGAAWLVIRMFDEKTWDAPGFNGVPKLKIDNEAFFIAISSEGLLAFWAAFNNLLKRPWFSRAWVIQEIALASDIQVICGKYCCKWDTLCSVLQYITVNHLTQLLKCSGPQLIALDGIRQLSHKHADNNPIDLLMSWLFITQQFQCQDDRDRIFSLAGLVSSEQFRAFVVDYSTSCDELYIKIAREAVTTMVGLQVLSFASNGMSPRYKLPSWVPDWSLEDTGGQLISSIKFKAGGARPKNVSVSGTSNVLTMRGIITDEILAMGAAVRLIENEVFEFPTVTQEPEMDMKSGLEVVWDVASDTYPYPTGEDMVDVVGRTLVLDQRFSAEHSDEAQPFGKAHHWALNYFGHAQDSGSGLAPQEAPLSTLFSRLEYANRCRSTWKRKKICSSKKRYLGWVPFSANPGDIVFIPTGSELPYIMRKLDDEYYQLLGDCFFHGIMYGEAFEGDGLVEQEIKIK